MEKKEWKVTTGAWQQFYERWRDSSVGSKFDNQFPYTLELGVDLEGNSLLPFHDGETSKNRILVTKSYEDMFYRLLRLRKKDMGQARGAVITGQPGVGAPLRPYPYPCDNSPAHPFSRKNDLPKVHARAADFS